MTKVIYEVVQHDGSILRLRKVDESYDANNRIAAMNTWLHKEVMRKLQENGAGNLVRSEMLERSAQHHAALADHRPGALAARQAGPLFDAIERLLRRPLKD